jgi:hypothetical protein
VDAGGRGNEGGLTGGADIANITIYKPAKVKAYREFNANGLVHCEEVSMVSSKGSFLMEISQ